MSKSVRCFGALLALLVLCSCGAEGSRYVMALAAYHKIKPAMLAWHGDAIVLEVSTSPSERADERIRRDGRASYWIFLLCSPSAQKETEIRWIGWMEGRVRVGIPEAAGGEWDRSCRAEGVPMDSIVDSDRAIAVALEGGAGPAETLICMNTYHDLRSWQLEFGELYDPSGNKHVLIDGVTGEITRSDFAN